MGRNFRGLGIALMLLVAFAIYHARTVDGEQQRQVAATASAPQETSNGPTMEDVVTTWSGLTELQRAEYQQTIRGTWVRWNLEVSDVQDFGTVVTLASVESKVLVVVFELPTDAARQLDKGQQITIEGTISDIGVPRSDGRVVKELARALSLVVELDDVTVL